MTTESYADIIHRWVEQGWNGGKLGLVDELFAESYVLHAGGQDTSGREAFKQFVATYRTAFPDFHVTIEEMVAEGDRVVWRFMVRGTHTGPLMGLPPTGRSMSIDGIVLSRFADGFWAEDYATWDALGMMQQLDAIPAAA
jgi:steroid delta-isomerase-like uncharacterized protein